MIVKVVVSRRLVMMGWWRGPGVGITADPVCRVLKETLVEMEGPTKGNFGFKIEEFGSMFPIICLIGEASFVTGCEIRTHLGVLLHPRGPFKSM